MLLAGSVGLYWVICLATRVTAGPTNDPEAQTRRLSSPVSTS